jgi:hypothetical protein
MWAVAKGLEFGRFAELRDQIRSLERRRLGIVEERKSRVSHRT